MTAQTVKTNRDMTGLIPERSGQVLAPGDGFWWAETWKRDIIRQLKRRDQNQHAMFQDLIRFCKTDKYKFKSRSFRHVTD